MGVKHSSGGSVGHAHKPSAGSGTSTGSNASGNNSLGGSQRALKSKILPSLGPLKIIPCDISSLSLHLSGDTYTLSFADKTTFTGKSSPSSRVNLSEGTKDQLKIPADAHSFCWLYPCLKLDDDLKDLSPAKRLLTFGGYAYLGEAGAVAGVNAIEGGLGSDMEFIGPYVFEDAGKREELERAGRIQPVTLPALLERGITKFCWLVPHEKRSDGSVLCTNGAFLYVHSTETFYFKVKDTSKPVWEWEYKDIWQAYNSLSSVKLEEYYTSGKEQVNITVDNDQFSVDFVHMKQLNLKNGEERKIRRTFWVDTQGNAKWACYVKKKWESYKEEENAALDAAFFSSALSGAEQCITLYRYSDGSSVPYEVDFSRLKQKNTTTGFERPVRRATSTKIQNQRIPWAKRTRVKVEDINLPPEQAEPCSGCIIITVRGARNIGINLGSSPCVIVTTDFSSFNWTTGPKASLDVVMENTQQSTHVIWNDECCVDVSRDNQAGNILFTIFDYKDQNKRVYLGRAALGLHEVINLGYPHFTKQLDFESEKKSNLLPPGELELSLSYTPRSMQTQTRQTTYDRILPRPSLQTIFSNPEVLRHLSEVEKMKLSAPRLPIEKIRILTTKHKDILASTRRDPTMNKILEETIEEEKITQSTGNDYLVPPKLMVDNVEVDMAPYLEMDVVEGETGVYAIGHKLGSGAFGVVKKATNIKTKDTVAVKIINIDDCNEREIQIMRIVKNRYCVSYIDSLETDESFYIVMEFCSQGDLFDAIEADTLNESAVKKAMLDTLRGLQYLHMNGIIHRDIKPENILHYYTCDATTNKVVDNWKIADFGIATFFTEGRYITSSTGTTQYKAPEMFPPARYTKSADLWAVGITAYVCLTGRFVWGGDSDEEVYESIRAYRIDYDNEFTPSAFAFILKLLDLNAETRMNIMESLNHSWFSTK